MMKRQKNSLLEQSTQITETPVLTGKIAKQALKQSKKKPSEKSRLGEQILISKFEKFEQAEQF